MAYDELDDLFGEGSKGPAGFPKMALNDVHGGIIFKVEKTEKRNVAGEIEYYDNSTDPKPCVITWVITDLRDPANPEDDGARRIWWSGNALWELQQFQKANKFGKPLPGGEIYKKMIGEKNTGKGNPMKLHAAKYVPPTPENLVKAMAFAAKYEKSSSGAKDEFFGESSFTSSPVSGGGFGSGPTLDSMRGGSNAFQGDAPF